MSHWLLSLAMLGYLGIRVKFVRLPGSEEISMGLWSLCLKDGIHLYVSLP